MLEGGKIPDLGWEEQSLVEQVSLEKGTCKNTNYSQ